MLLYATTTDWDGDAPANAASLLRSASLRVASATRTAVYVTDADGYPTATALRDALRDATLAQARAWAAAGVDPATPATTTSRVAASKSIAGASVTYADAQQAVAARETLLAGLVQDAVLILEQAGLLGGRPVVYG